MLFSDVNGRRLRLVAQILQLPEGGLADVERVVNALLASNPAEDGEPTQRPAHQDWPHAPVHRISEHGTYLVTTGTYQKVHYFGGSDRLDHLEAKLLSLAKEAG